MESVSKGVENKFMKKLEAMTQELEDLKAQQNLVSTTAQTPTAQAKKARASSKTHKANNSKQESS